MSSAECECGKRLGQLTCPICSEVGKAMNENDFDSEYDLDRSMRLKKTIEQVFEENKELLDRLGSDYDENGTPYWEKWHTNGVQ